MPLESKPTDDFNKVSQHSAPLLVCWCVTHDSTDLFFLSNNLV